MARRSRSLRGPVLGDLIVATVAFALTLAVLAGHSGEDHGLDPVGAVLAAASCFPLLAHRRAPLAVFTLTTVASATLAGLGYPIGVPFGPTAALFYLASDARTPARLGRTAAAVVGLYAVHVGATAIRHPRFPTTPVLAGIGLWGATWIIGDQVRQRRERLADLTERARRAEHEMERERRLAAAEERTRIARDLHDSAAHAINVILVQAGGALLIQDRDPDGVTSALTTIEGVARETIDEIDRLIRGLRSEERPRQTAGPSSRRSGWRRWRRWPAATVPPVIRSRSASRVTPDRLRRVSIRPPTGSCRSRSPTPPGTAAGQPRSWSPMARTGSS